MKTKITLFSPQFPPLDWSGRNVIAYNLAKYLSKNQKYDLKILSTFGNNDKGEIREIFSKIIRVHLDEKTGTYSPFYSLFSSVMENILMKEIINDIPEFVIFQDLVYIPANFLLKLKQLKIKTVIHLHNYYPFCIKFHLFRYAPCKVGLCNGLNDENECLCCYKQSYFQGFESESKNDNELINFIKLRRKYLSLIYKSADVLIAPSNYISNIYKSLLGIDCTILRHGVAGRLRKIIKKKNTKPIISYIGSIDLNKGIKVAIDAFSGIKNAFLKIWGTGDLSILTNELLKNKNISYCGRFEKKDLKKIFEESDYSLVPSYSENYPNTILESLSYNTPVIASNTGGIPEMIEDGKNGFLFERGDSNSLREVIKHITNRKIMSKMLIQNIKPLKSLNQMGKDYENVLDNLEFSRTDISIFNDLEEEINLKQYIFNNSYLSNNSLIKKGNFQEILEYFKKLETLKNSPAEKLKLFLFEKLNIKDEILKVFKSYSTIKEIDDPLYWGNLLYDLNEFKYAKKCLKEHVYRYGFLKNDYLPLFQMELINLHLNIISKKANIIKEFEKIALKYVIKLNGNIICNLRKKFYKKVFEVISNLGIKIKIAELKLVYSKFKKDNFDFIISLLYNLASNYQTSGDLLSADDIFSMILKKLKQRKKNEKFLSGTYYHLAEICIKTNKKLKAKNLLKKTLKITPEHKKALELFSLL